MVGIIQEQHPDRARLFMQWKQMDWPVLVDSYNLLGVSAVPIAIAIDEHGVVRAVRPGLDELEQDFLDLSYPEPPGLLPATPASPAVQLLEKPGDAGTAQAWRDFATAQALWATERRPDESVGAFESAIQLEPGHGPTHFRLGVALRKRYDSPRRQPDDFQQAVKHWLRALELDPNQYIWRRRIQQYGPRLDKPYPFYDWVLTARQEIRSRGETPVDLTVEPGGAELASPVRAFPGASQSERQQPDPEGRVFRDPGRLIHVETTVVPHTSADGTQARLHAVFRPVSAARAHWNNEAEPLEVWLDPPAGWVLDSRHGNAPLAPEPVSDETRRVELEIDGPRLDRGQQLKVPGYALYYVCEDVDGVCLYRRQDISFTIEAPGP